LFLPFSQFFDQFPAPPNARIRQQSLKNITLLIFHQTEKMSQNGKRPFHSSDGICFNSVPFNSQKNLIVIAPFDEFFDGDNLFDVSYLNSLEGLFFYGK
jgi:hypothetical protein